MESQHEQTGDGAKVWYNESKIQELKSFIGLSAREQVGITPPKQSNNKGGGKRIKGGK